MNVVEEEILDNLLALEKAAREMASANPKPDLLPIFSRLDELARQLPAETDPLLLHFLHRKSYQKACAMLQERRSQAGKP